MSLDPLQIRAIPIQVSEKILQRMHRAIADGCRVSDTIRKVIVNPHSSDFALNELRCKFETLCEASGAHGFTHKSLDSSLYLLTSPMASRRPDNPPVPHSVRYGASGAPKPVGPRLNSPPRPGQWPWAGRFFFQPLPLPPSRLLPRSMPRTAPRP